MTDARIIRIGIAPLFLISLSLSRSEIGVHAGFAFHIYKFGLHVGLSAID